MAIKKSELYSSIWTSCDELRGGMDASQYKDYVLTLLFVKYVSDKYGGQEDSIIEIPEGGSFKDMVALKGKKDIGDKINQIISKLAEKNDLKGVIDLTDFNDEEKLGKGKAMVDRLSNLIGIFENPALNFRKNRAEDDDILGDAYEYLMKNFATQSGKSKGQFYTPAEVSRILAKVVGAHDAQTQEQTVYDPTCGSGSLLLKVAAEADSGLSIYGQEMDVATKALAVMNMWLHGNPTAEIWRENTLSDPHWLDRDQLKTFDFVVANPPFSNKAWKTGFDPENDPYGRFEGFGIPPPKNGDYAFLLHIIKSMKSKGKAAVILPHGVLFRGNAEAKIRKNIIQRGYIKAILGLPTNLFFGTGIHACVIILDKENAVPRRSIFMIDASKGFIKDGNKNRLREQDIHKIVDVFTNHLEVLKYSRMIPFDKIEKNEYNLNISKYIDSQIEEDIQDISAHLQGGIPDRDIENLTQYWEVYPSLRADLIEPFGRDGYNKIKVSKNEIKNTIFNHSEFVHYCEEMDKLFQSWKEYNISHLKRINNKTSPKLFIEELSERLLRQYANKPLIDKYDIYQHLMDYWNDTMKDDVYMIVEDGWKATLEPIKDSKGEIKGGQIESDLVPKSLVINRYFPEDKAAIEDLEEILSNIFLNKEILLDEHGSDEGHLSEVINDKGNVTKGNLTNRIREIKEDDEFVDELGILEQYHLELKNESSTKKDLKEIRMLLDEQLAAKYPKLSREEVKILVVDDKWLTILRKKIKRETYLISFNLAQRLVELHERYDSTLSEIEIDVGNLNSKVSDHLKRMGFDQV